MDATTHLALPWEALKHTEGPIPWPAIRQFAEGLGTDSQLLEPLLDIFDQTLEDPYSQGTFEDLYVPAIIALAAPRLSELARKHAARILIDALIIAYEHDDEVFMEALSATCGALGPEAVLPAVLEAMPSDYQPWLASFGLWHMMHLALDTQNVFLRARVVDSCVRALQKVEKGLADIDCVEPAVWVLARLEHIQARPLLERLLEQTDSDDIRDALELMDGKWTYDYPEPWQKPVEEWLKENWKSLKSWYAERDTNPLDDLGETEYDDDDPEAGERRAYELTGQFMASPAALSLSESMQQEAGFIVNFLLQYAWDYEGVSAEELDESTLREVLLEIFPRKITADRELFKYVIPVSQVFLGWLESQGILKDAKPLIRAIADWDKEIVSRADDPKNWGMAKGFSMLAKSRGVDISDERATRQFMMEYNRQLLATKQDEPELQDDEDFLPPAYPIVNEAPKIGRNAPCPCGSGKKYKKCCGREEVN